MPKGLFTASVVVLFDRTPDLSDIEAALDLNEGVLGKKSADEAMGGWLSGPSVLVQMPGNPDGTISIDMLDRRWPDGMGSPEVDPELFAAWSLGGFGPFVFPGCLKRACQHAIAWDGADRVAKSHAALVRVRSSYVLGKGKQAPVLPEGYDAVAEMRALTQMAKDLLALPGALAWFDPSGEVILGVEQVQRSVGHHAAHDLPPFDLWSNVRLFHLADADGWALMDTVGMAQLGVSDQEVLFQPDVVNPNEMAPFLRNIALYLMEEGPVIEDGHTVDGPGGAWCASRREESLAPAPRPTLRWSLEGGAAPPEQLR